MRKRIESLVLTLCMVLTLIPAAALPARAAGEQTVTTFDALKSAFDGASTNADSPTEITLGANIDTTEGLTVKSGTYVVLDLAGHTIKRTSGNGYVIGVSGNLTLNDSSGTNTGKITGGNRSDGYGGGVYVLSSGTFKMTGGTITGNSAQYGGGVAVYDGTFEMTGGSITGNNATTDGGGVHASGTGTFKLSGNPVISGNYKNGTTDADGVYTSGTSNNVYATSTNLLQVTGELTDGADIHMSTGLGNVFTNSTDVSLNDASKFHSDKGSTYEITQDVDGQLMVVQFTSVSTWDDLRTNLNNGGKYKLTADVTYASGEGLSVPSGKTVILDLAGHTINANQNNKICIKVEGELALNDSSVGKTGQITGSKRTNETEGCGVLVEGTFTMNGGKITGNSTTQTSGAGVYVKTGTFNMNGGEISNNTAAKSGGGVFVGPTATFNMNGGTITNNKAGDPSSCYGGGVFVQGTFTISGSASVTGNTLSNNDKSNVHLHSVTGSNKYITVTGPLTGDGEIGVTVNNPPTSPSSPVTLTNTADGKLAYNVAGKFVSDRTDYTIYKDANDDQLKLAAPMTWNSVKTALNNGQDVKLTNDIKDTGSAGALQVPSNKTVTLDLNGYTIDRNRSSAEANGYVIKVEGSLTLKDTSEAKNGTITGGSNTGDGGGVYVNGGTLVMEGGTISNNTAASGGGIYVGKSSSTGSFTMSGGTITGNRTTGTANQTGNGGGVNAFDGTFTMSNGEISNNTANRFGGGVEAKTFTMSGGTISGNTANENGGGVFIDTGGTLKLSGTPTISGNKKSGADNNVGLLAGTTITVTDTLSNSTPIGVTTQNAPSDSPIKVTNNLGTYANTSQFASDNTDYDLYAPSTGSSTYVVYLYTKKTITWKSQDGGTVLETDSNLKAGTKPHYDGAEPTKAPDEQYTYTFAGWATSANQESGRSDSSYDGVTKDTTYYAAFSKTARSYTLTWDANGGEITGGGTASGSVAYGTTLNPPTVTRAGYTFNGWSPAVAATMPAENATYTAQWTPTNYTITYDLAGGTNGASPVTSYTIESEGTLPTPTKSAHTFNGWKVTTAGGNWTADTVLAAGASLTGRYGDVTLTAQWINNGTVTAPTFNPAGGSYTGTQSVTISCATDGATIYYTTDGTTPTASSTQYTGAISISTDTTIKAYAVKDGMTDSTVATATYTISSAPATYTVSFDANGGSTVTAQTVESGNTATRPADPTRGGYTFGGWFTDESYATAYDFSTPVTAGLTLYAKWTANPTPTPSPTPAPSYDDTDYEEPEPTYTVTAPVSGDENTVDVTVSVTGTAATLRTADIESALSGNDETGDVVIDVSNLKQDVTSITIPAKTVAAIAAAVADEENSTDSLTVKLTDGTVTFDAAAVDAITEQAEGKDLRLNLDGVETSAMSDTQQAATANLEVEGVLDVYMTSGNTRISDFKGGSAEIRLPFTAPDGRTAAEYRVWYVAEDGALTDQRARYDTSDNCFVFTVTHFSNYVVAYNGCPQDETCPISAFTDADPAEWYHDGVHYVLENGIMSGYGGAETGSFGPNDKTSRAMIAQILWNMEGKPVVNYLLTFSDVAEGMWYTEAVRWVTAEGIMNGYGDGLFGPNDAMTREQLVTIVHRYATYKGVDVSVGEDTNILSYDDAFDVSEWAIPAMQWAVGSGAVGGRTDRTLNPKDTATRAEIATIMMRYSIEISK